MTPIADMVARLLEAGVAADLVALAVATVERATNPRTSTDASKDDILDGRRAADRLRQKAKRDQLKSEKIAKQTMGDASSDVHGSSTDASKDEGLSVCNLLTSLSSTEATESKRESKEVVVERGARARGTRLSHETKVSTQNRYFAAAAGIPEDEIDGAWAEFIDFWIAVPGQRGTKLNWDATWRNRVRAITPWKGKGRINGAGHRTLANAADDLIARAEEFERARGPVVDH